MIRAQEARESGIGLSVSVFGSLRKGGRLNIPWRTEKVVGEMRGLERAVEWLRPFVEKHGWDYCVVWKLGDEPSRFVEFVDCCCAGGYVSGTVKAEKSGDHIEAVPVCRDFRQEHRIHTKACETLAQIPATMSLYSGIHTEVSMTNEPKWLSEDEGTLVLIPLGGGLIELFASKRVDKDQITLDFIKYQYKASLELDTLQNYLNPSFQEDSQETELGQCLQNSSPDVLFTDTTSRPQSQPVVVVRVKRPQTGASFPGSSNGSNPSLNSGSGLMSQDAPLPPSLSNSSCSKKPKYLETGKFTKPQGGVAASVQANGAASAHKASKEGSKAKNLEVERKRRSRIKDGEFQLRALVPNISKMDRASIIGDAITYIIELKETVQDLEEELKKDDHGENAGQGVKFSSKQKTRIKFKNSQVQVEVREICERNFLLRIVADPQRSGFSRLMGAVSSTGLQVEEFNIISWDGLLVSSLQVKAAGNFQPDQLREALRTELEAATRA